MKAAPITSWVGLKQRRCDHEWHDPIQKPGCPVCWKCGIVRSVWVSEVVGS